VLELLFWDGWTFGYSLAYATTELSRLFRHFCYQLHFKYIVYIVILVVELLFWAYEYLLFRT